MFRTSRISGRLITKRRAASFVSSFAALVAMPSLAFAQVAPPVAPAAPTAPATAAPAAPETPAPVTPVPTAPVPTPAPTVPVAPAADPVEPEPAEAAPMPEAPAVEEAAAEKPSINVSVWGRVDVTLNDPADPEKLDDISSTGLGEFHFSGEVADGVGWTANLVATYGGGEISGSAGIMDLIAQFGVHDPFNIWAGRMLVASDRSNFSGAWFMSPWDYPGLYMAGAPPVGPMQGPRGRNDGVTVWGNIMDGHVKYYLGAYDLHDGASAPLISGRVNISLTNPEAGYYSNSTYYGGKDLLALGVGFQSKKNGSVGAPTFDPDGMEIPGPVDNYSLVNADLLFEKNFGADSGTLDVEAAAYFFSGDNQAIETHMFGVVSYLLPFAVGPGKLQPTFRLQQAKTQVGDNTWQIVEGYLGYVVKDFSLRGSLGFVSSNLEGAAGGEDLKSNAIKLGVQFMQ